MKKFIAIASVLLITSCAYPLSSTGPGGLFTATKEGVSANNNQSATRSGTACGYNVLGVAAFGDSSVDQAKMNGGIKNIATMDREYFSVLGIFAKSCLIVKGN